MVDVSFRRATEADIQAIVDLLADDILGRGREDPGTPPNSAYLEAFSAIDADPNQLLVVATANDDVIGTLQLTFIPGLTRMGAWRGQIEGVRIAAGCRGAGLGQQMFEWAIEQCRSRGCQLVQLTTDRERPEAHRFYENLGFVSSHIGYKLAL
ncbi:MAG: GNAT family N-acetyltransferase [Thermomicrobiales bacterium]